MKCISHWQRGSPQISTSIMAGMRLTNKFGDERARWSRVMTTRPDIANPVTNSPKTLMPYICVVRSSKISQ